MRYYKLLILGSILFFFCNFAFAQESSEGIKTWLEESDGSPSIIVYKTIVSNGTLTDPADGTASLNTSGSGSVSDTAYGASWDTVTTIAPSKNAVYDNFGATPGGSLGGTWASPTIDDLFIKNSESDVMTGTLTADGFTLGNNENFTFGTETFTFDAITSNDFELSDDLNINDATPHLKLVPTTGDAFETYAFGNEWYFTNVTDSKVLWKTTTGNLINFYNQTGFNFPDVAPTDNYILKYDAALGRMAWEADATGAGYAIYIEEGDVAKANNTAADLYVDFDATDFETAVVGNEVNVTIPDDGHAHTTTSISGLDISADTNLAVSSPITLTGDSVGMVNQGTTTTVLHGNAAGNPSFGTVDISADTNLAGDTEIVLTGDALSIASTITRDTELAAYQTVLTNSAGLLGALNDETGTGLSVFNDSPSFVDDITLATAGVKLTGSGGTLTMLGLGVGADEDIKFDLDTTANTLLITSPTSGLLKIDAGSIIFEGKHNSSDATAGADATTGGLTFKDGLYTTGTATTYAPIDSPTFTTKITTPIIDLTGGQIAFPASQSASTNANTLDDYEEGTWTPTLARTGSNYAYTAQTGTYRKIGNLVTVIGYIASGAITTQGTGENTIGGLPFTAAAGTAAGEGVIGYNTVFTTSVAHSLHVTASSTVMVVIESANTQSNLAVDFIASKYLSFSVVYLAAS